MANYSAIKAAVNGYIKRNGRKEITGSILNAVLNATIDSLGRFYQFAGGALPTDDPGTPDQNVCYLAGEPGLYIHFGNIRVNNEEVALLFWDGEWKKQSVLYGIQEINASVDSGVGDPSVDVSYSVGRLVLTFHNLKGEPGVKGDTGNPAGFGTIGADITGGVGTPGVSVQTSGSNAAKNIMFHFTNLKGNPGISSVIATIDNTSGNPSCQVSLVNGQLTLAFSGLKGLKGDTGVSADYPITIYNGLDSDATDQALAAAQGKILKERINQVDQKVEGMVQTAELDFAISDGLGYDIAEFRGGHIKTKNFDSSQNATTERNGLMSKEDKTKLDGIEDGAEANKVDTGNFPADLAISDENENSIVIFRDGHIKTKNFDSSKDIFNRVSKFAGKRLSIVGDSISSYSGYPYPNSGYANVYPNQSAGVTSPSLTWWGIVCDKLGLTLLRNCSWAGSKCSGDSASISSAEAGCSTKRINDLSDGLNDPDIVIAYIGVNDWIQSVPLGVFDDTELVPEDTTNTDTFVHAYMIMIDKIINTYPNARVFCTTFPTTAHSNHDTDGLYPDINKVGGVSITAFNNVVRQIADAFGCGIIDLNRCGLNFANIDTYTSDKIHPNSAGMEMFANTFINELMNNY